MWLTAFQAVPFDPGVICFQSHCGQTINVFWLGTLVQEHGSWEGSASRANPMYGRDAALVKQAQELAVAWRCRFVIRQSFPKAFPCNKESSCFSRAEAKTQQQNFYSNL